MPHLLSVTTVILHELAHYFVSVTGGDNAHSHTNLDFGNSYPKKKGGESGYYMEGIIFGGLPMFVRIKSGDRFAVTHFLLSKPISC